MTPSAVRSAIENDDVLCRIRDIVRVRLWSDPSHDLEHSIRVAAWMLRICGTEVAGRTIITAALCHDIVNLPKNSARSASAGDESAKLAETILADNGFEKSVIATISETIRDHSFARNVTPQTLLSRALQDADRLDALGAIGILRNATVATINGAAYYDPLDPFAQRRPLNDLAYLVDHYYTKLLRLPELMWTDIAKIEAQRRVQFMKTFLCEFGLELSLPVTPPTL